MRKCIHPDSSVFQIGIDVRFFGLGIREQTTVGSQLRQDSCIDIILKWMIPNTFTFTFFAVDADLVLCVVVCDVGEVQCGLFQQCS